MDIFHTHQLMCVNVWEKGRNVVQLAFEQHPLLSYVVVVW
jgi:hypothetical protein